MNRLEDLYKAYESAVGSSKQLTSLHETIYVEHRVCAFVYRIHSYLIL